MRHSFLFDEEKLIAANVFAYTCLTAVGHTGTRSQGADRTEAGKKRPIDYRARCAISSTKNVRPGWGMLSTAGLSAIGSE